MQFIIYYLLMLQMLINICLLFAMHCSRSFDWCSFCLLADMVARQSLREKAQERMRQRIATLQAQHNQAPFSDPGQSFVSRQEQVSTSGQTQASTSVQKQSSVSSQKQASASVEHRALVATGSSFSVRTSPNF